MSNTALLLIDVQKGLDTPYFGRTQSNPDASNNIANILQHWRKLQLPVIHVQHCSIEPNSPLREGQAGNEIQDKAKPVEGEPVFKKSTNSAFIGTTLEHHLRSNQIDSLIIVGLTVEHCVSTTTRMAGNLGFDVTLINDATSANEHVDFSGDVIDAKMIHRVSIASMLGEFCNVLDTADLLAMQSFE
jgi:nicotinamidase-related amidase